MKRGILTFGGNTVNVWIDVEDGEIRASSVRPKESIHFADFARKYEAECVSMMKPASQASIKSVLGVLVGHFGARKLGEIGTEEIQRFITGNLGSPKTIKNQIGIFRMCWNKARAWGYAKTNPFEFLSMPRAKSKEQPFFTPEQCRLIIGKAQEPYKTMFLLAANTGLRAGEILGLSPMDVDLDARILRVRRSAYRGEIQSPKTGNAVRTVKLASDICPHLRPFMRSELLFPDKNYQQVLYQLNKILESLGISQKGAGMHCFRRLAASAFSSVGAPDAIVQKSLGHATIGMSQHYMRPLEDDRNRIAESVWNLLEEPRAKSVAVS